MKKTYLIIIFLSIQKMLSQNVDSLQIINEITIEENRLKLPLSKSARNIQVITAETIQKLPAKSLNEVLTYSNGVDIRQRGPFGTQADVSIDGGNFEQTLILVNGIKISDPQTAHNTLNLPFPLETIERIEILRGPAARIYGANSLTGAINIVTKKPSESNIFSQLYTGSNFEKNSETDRNYYHSTGIQLGGTLAKQKHSHQLFGSFEKGSGYNYNTANKNKRIMYQGNLDISDKNKFEFLGGYTNSRFGANGFYAAPGDKEAEELVETILFTAQSTHQLTESFQIKPQIGYRYTYDDYRYFRNDLSKARSQHYGNTFNSQVNATYNYKTGILGFGAEYRKEKINSSNIGDHQRDNYGMYTEWKTTPFKLLDVTVGAYSQYNSAFGWSIFPGADMSYLLNDSWRILANVGSSQRIPSFNDLYLQQAPGNLGNPNLQPETAWQWEAGWKYNSKSFTWRTNFFERNINDFIDWNRLSLDVPYQSSNEGNLKTFGISTDINYNLNFNDHLLQFKISYTFIDSSWKNKNLNIISKYALESLQHQLIALIDYQYKNWKLHLGNRYQKRLTNTDYFLTDFRISFSQNKFNYFLDFQNIGNATYVEAGAVPMPGRWISLGVKFRS